VGAPKTWLSAEPSRETTRGLTATREAEECVTNDRLLKQTVRITNREHPHYRESGKLTGKVISLFGKPMAEVKLGDCRHGGDACFVRTGDIEIDRCQP
jgi:hypothetical protein